MATGLGRLVVTQLQGHQTANEHRNLASCQTSDAVIVFADSPVAGALKRNCNVIVTTSLNAYDVTLLAEVEGDGAQTAFVSLVNRAAVPEHELIEGYEIVLLKTPETINGARDVFPT